MKLKHLTLRGFKSFADRTRLDFSTGINVVVGPNGSGKSNILDAIAWVMGTQGTKSLRTESRPPLSRAEVSLTFANDELLVPIDLAEITITRRIFRDGTSEYELNGAPCRLLDIQELLSDGGIGKQQHVLVNQGQVGEILNARPEDHRAVIEEAAGVTKHRSRRDRAIRRLERTQHDVERLNDILAEKKKAMRPLKRQANAAARHDSVRDEARQLTMWLGAEDLRRIRSRLVEAKAQFDEDRTVRDEADAALSEVMASLEGLRKSAGDVGAQLTRDTAAAARLETVRERLRRIGLVARERRRSLEARIEGAGDRREDLEIERDELVTTLENAEEEERRALEAADRAEAVLKALEDEERALSEQIQLPTEGVVANLRGDLRSLETAAERDTTELNDTRARLDVVQARIEDERAEIDRLNAEIESTDAATTPLSEAYTAARTARETAQAAWEEAEATSTELRMAAASAHAKVEALEAALDGLVADDAKAIADEADGVKGLVVSALDAPPEIAAAVDAALGVWRNAYLAEGRSAVQDAASRMKAAATGGVAFVHGDRPVAKTTREIAKAHGAETLIDALGPSADTSVAAALLGDVILVQGWNAGRELVEQEPDVRVVTPEGDLITATGMMVAQPDGVGPAALEAASVSLEAAEADLLEADARMEAAHERFEAARADEHAALEALEATEATLAGLTEALAMVDRARAASMAEASRLTDRIEALKDTEGNRAERIAVLRDRVAEFQGEEAARQAAWEALNARRAEVAERRDAARTERQTAAGAVASLAERRRIAEARLTAIDAEMNQLVLVPDTDASIGELTIIEERAVEVTAVVEQHIEALRDRQRMLREQVGSANAELSEAEAARETLESTRRRAAESVQKLEVEIAQLEVRDESVAETLRRDADASEEVALAVEAPELAEGVDPKERLESLRADLRRMGPINPLAAAEYEELSHEVDDLEAQLADLNESRQEIRKVIEALDEQMQTLFVEAFDDIAGFYEENFGLVFPGGKGRLRITDADDPLSAGVVVEAQPAGKKVGRLSLLSGGERSLAALAFLFAVFRARPSPFYVLDEVEAALDDANLHRFLELVETLRNDVQLVIITHQQQTMSAADVLYGVTMEPGASSQVLSKKMEHIHV